MFTYFCIDPLEMLYGGYDIRPKFVDKPSVITCFPNTFFRIGVNNKRLIHRKL